MKVLIAIPVLFSSVFLFQPGCGTSQIDCYEDQLPFVTVGYTFDEVSEVSIIRYEDGSNFTQRKDSTFFRFRRSQSSRDNDTIPLGGLEILNFNPDKMPAGTAVMSGHEYEILIHKTGNSYRVNEVANEGRFTEEQPRSSHMTCTNNITTYKFNGELSSKNHQDAAIYLVK